jgi:hypothetical protein
MATSPLQYRQANRRAAGIQRQADDHRGNDAITRE